MSQDPTTGTGRGWISIDRKILDSRLFSRSGNHVKIALYLLLSANHKPKYYRGVLIERGQCIRSYTQLSEACDVSRKTVRGVLAIMTSENFISIDEPFGAHRGHRITVCNYDTYQSETGREGTLRAQQGHTEGTLPTTNNNDKKVNNEENEKNKSKEVAEVVSFYNDLSCKFPKCKKVSATRRAQINARLDEYGFDNVVETIRTASMSTFLNGGNDRGWKADLEWITKDANYTKITEGKYRNAGIEIDAETSAWLEKIAAGDFREWVAPITRWVEHKTAAGCWDSQTLKYFRRDMENRYAVRGVEIFGNAINESISKKSASIIWSFN